MEEQHLTSTETLPLVNSCVMHFTAVFKSRLTAESTTSHFRLLLRSKGPFEVVADSDLMWGFIQTQRVFNSTGQRLTADVYGYSCIKTPRSVWLWQLCSIWWEWDSVQLENIAMFIRSTIAFFLQLVIGLPLTMDLCLHSHPVGSVTTLIFHVLVFHVQTAVESIKPIHYDNCGHVNNTGTEIEESRVSPMHLRDIADFEYVDFMGPWWLGQ